MLRDLRVNLPRDLLRTDWRVVGAQHCQHLVHSLLAVCDVPAAHEQTASSSCTTARSAPCPVSPAAATCEQALAGGHRAMACVQRTGVAPARLSAAGSTVWHELMRRSECRYSGRSRNTGVPVPSTLSPVNMLRSSSSSRAMWSLAAALTGCQQHAHRAQGCAAHEEWPLQLVSTHHTTPCLLF
eukprot:TRINITY_DN3033_c0_g1_i4.p1 TRINITY_DN3033_c0_g1~~TRINITY_DN3033_c0_g1_i4.p1  ORF type:complete len:184 (+),score=32.76 TRINITY_DN3033_c0_g1_i4:512-1063(+)